MFDKVPKFTLTGPLVLCANCGGQHDVGDTLNVPMKVALCPKCALLHPIADWGETIGARMLAEAAKKQSND